MQEIFIHKKDGKVQRPDKLEAFLLALEEGTHHIKATHKKKRSLNQNAYLHICFYLMVQGFQEIGYKEVDSPEIVKHIMKRMFLSYTIDNGNGGKIELVKRTRDLTKEEMAEFIDKIIMFASENLQIAIPPPNTQTLLFH